MQYGVAQALNDSETTFQAACAWIEAAARGVGGMVPAGTAATAVGAVNPVAAAGVLPAAYEASDTADGRYGRASDRNVLCG